MASISDGAWRLDPNAPEFHVRNFYSLMTVKGQFDRYDGTLDVAGRPAVGLVIDADSLDTKLNRRDRHLRSTDFFDVANHPQVRFESDSATLAGDRMKVRGQLHAAGEHIPLDVRAPSKLIVRGRLVPGAPDMKAITLDELGTPPTLRDDLPAPTPGPNEVLVRVHASSVNPVDNAIAAGMLKDMAEHAFPVTPGRDYAGVVEQIGADVTRFSVEDEVSGFIPAMSPTVHDGAWAELIVVPESMSIARKPDSVDIAIAGAAPLAAITAMTAIDALELSQGDTVLIVGATGGVGSFAVQLAAAAGATVIAPALPEDEAYLRALGATEVLSRDGDIAASVRESHPDGVDALLDLVSYAPGTYDAALKHGARVASPNNAASDGPSRTNVIAMPTTDNLQRLGELLAAGALKVHIQHTYALDDAGKALQALGARHTQGKLAIQVA